MKRKGVEFEQKGHEAFIDRFGPFRYIPSQWWQYQIASNQLKFCQTDGLLFTPESKKLTILEFKFKHTAEAYYQIEQKYVPVLRRYFKGWTISVCEVVKWYDKDIPFPIPIKLQKDVDNCRPNEFGVHILNL